MIIQSNSGDSERSIGAFPPRRAAGLLMSLLKERAWLKPGKHPLIFRRNMAENWARDTGAPAPARWFHDTVAP